MSVPLESKNCNNFIRTKFIMNLTVKKCRVHNKFCSQCNYSYVLIKYELY